MILKIFPPLHLRSFFLMVLFSVILLFSPSHAVVYIGNPGNSTVLAIANLQASTRTDYYSPRSLNEKGQEEGARRVKAHVYLLLAAVACSDRNFRGVNFRSFFTLSYNTGTVYDVFHSGRRRFEHTQPEDYFYFEKFSLLPQKNNT
jgi:hypothetical protein